jgi:serine/threonine protein kinase/Tol biopolymer transport system component
MTLEQGTLLNGRYRIVDILGQGGMGSVYRAMDENLGVEVAVKENLFTTDEYSRQFRLEAVILASLRHPNLPRVTDHYVIEGVGQYLVMDYIEGEDLRQRMERMGTISEEDAILVGAAMSDALAYLHTRKPPVLHRDIKPGNVKITPEGQVYLVDFGLAKLIQGSQTTTTGARAMTPGYSPPEQYGTARTDPRSDIYSLGATLYAALTGVIPEDGLARVMDNLQLTPLRKHNPNISRRLAAAIEKAMEAYPDDRFQNAEEFRRALLNTSSKTQRLLDLDLNISVTPPPAGESPTTNNENPSARSNTVSGNSLTSVTMRMRRRFRKIASSGAWLVLALLVTLVMLLLSQGNLGSAMVAILPPNVVKTYLPNLAQTATAEPFEFIETEPTLTTTPTSTPTLSPTPEPTEVVLPSATSTPQGGTGIIAFASSRTGIPQVYLMNSDGTNIRPITNEQDGACQPDWSPDGLRLVYVSPCKSRQDSYNGSSLHVINVDGSGKTPLPTTLGGDFEPAWSPDGKRIAFTSLRDGYFEIYAITLDNNQVERLTDSRSISGSSYARQPAWNPFGTQLAYVLRRVGVTQIWLSRGLSVNSQPQNEHEQLTRADNLTNAFLPVWSPPDGDVLVFNQTNLDATAPAWLMRLRYEDRLSRLATQVDITPPIIDVSFSPDGFWIVFESKPDENARHDIYIVTVTGASIKRLTADPGSDFDPVWRPLPKTNLP